MKGAALSFAAEQDLEWVKEKGANRKGHGVYESTYHMVCKNGDIRYVLQRSRYKVLENGDKVIVAAYYDAEGTSLTDGQRREKAKLDSVQQTALAEKKKQHILHRAFLNVWRVSPIFVKAPVFSITEESYSYDL